MSQPVEMAAALKIKPEKVIAEYYLDRRERSRVLEKHREDLEQILAKRKEILRRRGNWMRLALKKKKKQKVLN